MKNDLFGFFGFFLDPKFENEIRELFSREVAYAKKNC